MRKRNPAASALLFFFAILFVGDIGLVGLLNATTLGQHDLVRPDESEEILEPSATQPAIPTRETNNKFGTSAAFRAIPTSTIQNTERLDENDAHKAEALLAHWSKLLSNNLFRDLSVDTAALEWVDQLAQTGHWLENDQWADFQAIALAGYLPEIRYWLGRDRWASFGSNTFDTSLGDGFLDDPDSMDKIKNRAASADYSSVSNYARVGGSNNNQKYKQPANVNIFEIMTSMIKKMTQQPVFYLIIVVGLGLLVWAFRRPTAS